MVEYHMSWPSAADPYYQHNIIDNNGRKNFYGINSVPACKMDGKFGPPVSSLETIYNVRKGTPTDVSLSIHGTFDDHTGHLSATVTASTTSELPAVPWRIHLAVVEGNLGAYQHVMRKMLPTYAGTAVTFSGPFPQTAAASYEYDVDPSYQLEHLRLVAFLQIGQWGTPYWGEVYQAAGVVLTEITEGTGVPVAEAPCRLGAAYPNPFNPTTTIPVAMREAGPARLEVLSVSGRLLRVLHEGELGAGAHDFHWDGRGADGATLPSGVYLVRLRMGGDSQLRRVVMLK
ncbi:MAG: T9SS type A sorting domain-containing protein [Candidatus Krumholzibacteriota bacterium]|nr:T9SS type A sorting domain-containing protein [Candidatus Krumholzibacteriota bacterium]